MLVDPQTANLLLKCYEGVSTDKARNAIETAPLERVVDMAWKVTKQGSRGRRPLGSGRQAAGGGGGVKIVHNKMLGGWFVVRGPHQTPLSGRFDSKEEAEASLRRESRRQAADWGSYGEPQRGAECDNCGSDAVKDGVCRFCGEGGPRLSDPKKWPANVVNRESSRRQAKGVKCKMCGKWLHDEVARAGHAHGPDGEVYDAEPQYGFESRGEYMDRGSGGLPPTSKRGSRGRRPLGERRASAVSEHTRRRQEWSDAHPGEERGWANGGYSGTVDDALRAMSDDERDGVYSRHPWLETPRREAARSVTLIGGGNTHRPEGWEWDRHLSAFTAHQARLFSCSCGDELDMPGYRHCRCGKVWNGYAVASGGDTRTAHADTYLVREVPVRKDVILAGRHQARKVTDHGFKGYADYPEMCVAERPGSGNTCNRLREDHANAPDDDVLAADVAASYAAEAQERVRRLNDDVERRFPGGHLERSRQGAAVRNANRRLAGEGDPQWYNDQVDSLGKKPSSQQKLDKARRDLKNWVGTNGGSYGKAQADKLKRLVKMYENDVARERQAGRVKDQWMKDREDAGEDPQWPWPSEVGQDSPKVSQSPVDWHRRDSGGKWTPPGVPAKKGKRVIIEAAACSDCGKDHVLEETKYVCPSCGYDEVTQSQQATCPECDYLDEDNWFDDRADIDVYSDQLWARDPAAWHRWDNMRDPYD
jgi:hypothetical protein